MVPVKVTALYKKYVLLVVPFDQTLAMDDGVNGHNSDYTTRLSVRTQISCLVYYKSVRNLNYSTPTDLVYRIICHCNRGSRSLSRLA